MSKLMTCNNNYQGRWNQKGKRYKFKPQYLCRFSIKTCFTKWPDRIRPPRFSDLLPSLIIDVIAFFLLTQLHICLSICSSTSFHPITYYFLMYIPFIFILQDFSQISISFCLSETFRKTSFFSSFKSFQSGAKQAQKLSKRFCSGGRGIEPSRRRKTSFNPAKTLRSL